MHTKKMIRSWELDAVTPVRLEMDLLGRTQVAVAGARIAKYWQWLPRSRVPLTLADGRQLELHYHLRLGASPHFELRHQGRVHVDAAQRIECGACATPARAFEHACGACGQSLPDPAHYVGVRQLQESVLCTKALALAFLALSAWLVFKRGSGEPLATDAVAAGFAILAPMLWGLAMTAAQPKRAGVGFGLALALYGLINGVCLAVDPHSWQPMLLLRVMAAAMLVRGLLAARSLLDTRLAGPA